MKNFREWVDDMLGKNQARSWDQKIAFPTEYAIYKTMVQFVTDGVTKELREARGDEWYLENKGDIYQVIKMSVAYQMYVIEEMAEKQRVINQAMGVK